MNFWEFIGLDKRKMAIKPITIEPFGQLEYEKANKQWFGRVENISPNNIVELSISVEHPDQDIDDKIELIKNLAADYESIVANLYDLFYENLKGTKYELTRAEIEQMYFLAAVVLKADNKTWWLVLEPDYRVTSIYNHFLRFTMIGRTIVWANFDVDLGSYGVK
jgi:hypothetical protein